MPRTVSGRSKSYLPVFVPSSSLLSLSFSALLFSLVSPDSSFSLFVLPLFSALLFSPLLFSFPVLFSGSSVSLSWFFFSLEVSSEQAARMNANANPRSEERRVGEERRLGEG